MPRHGAASSWGKDHEGLETRLATSEGDETPAAPAEGDRRQLGQLEHIEHTCGFEAPGAVMAGPCGAGAVAGEWGAEAGRGGMCNPQHSLSLSVTFQDSKDQCRSTRRSSFTVTAPPFTHVLQGDATAAALHGHRALLLCWPPKELDCLACRSLGRPQVCPPSRAHACVLYVLVRTHN